MQSLENSTVLITAGASGIGRVMAESFLKQKAKVHIADISQAAIDDCLQANPAMTASLCDVSDSRQVSDLFNSLPPNISSSMCLSTMPELPGPP